MSIPICFMYLISCLKYSNICSEDLFSSTLFSIWSNNTCFILGDFNMDLIRVGIQAISTEECDVTFQVCVSVHLLTRPRLVSLPYLAVYVYILFVYAVSTQISLYVCGMPLCINLYMYRFICTQSYCIYMYHV